MKYILTGFCYFLCFSTFAQTTADWWYFGRGGGLHFVKNEPVLVSGKTQAQEGCASISDTLGNLLFYTDGMTVWNKLQQVMPNGRGLAGHASSSMSAIIVPFPAHPGQYYIFTTDAVERATNGLQYSVLDMHLQGGNGDIVAGKKNIPIKKDVPEKVNAVPTADNKGYWIVTHDYPGESYFAYKLDAEGLNTEAVVSEEGSRLKDYGKMAPITQGTGFLKFSPDGNTLAMGYDDTEDGKAWGRLELFDFNRETGKLSHFKRINIGQGWIYGFEFSPNGKVIYATCLEKILQIDLVENKLFIAFDYKTNRSEQKWFFAMQLAPNGRIYVGEVATGNLSVINYPNEIGEKCGFQHAKIFTTQPQNIGLPLFVPSLLQIPPPVPKVDTILTQMPVIQQPTQSISIKDTIEDSFCFGTTYVFPNGKATKDTGYFKGYSAQYVYHLRYKTKAYINVYKYITIPADAKYRLPDGREVQDAKMYTSTIPTKGGCDSIIFTLLTVLPRKLVFAVNFAHDSYLLEGNAITILNDWVSLLHQQKTLRIELRGHTDTDATASYNMQLSEKRVNAVKGFLFAQGIDKEQIITQALGENEALYPTESNEIQKAENRRVEIRIVN